MSLSKENKVIIDGQTCYGGLDQPNLKFVKVNVDCWERIFDFLALRDILAMSRTCQRMRQIGGHYFRENFYGTECALRTGSSGLEHISIDYNLIDSADFFRFVNSITIGVNLNYLRTLSSMNLCSSLTALHLWCIDLSAHHLHGLENIQTNIETIELVVCCISDHSVGEFIASCPKLKCLQFSEVEYKSTDVKARLFRRTYPMLEHFQCACADTALEIPSFLELNPNIKRIEMIAKELLQLSLDTSTAQLDYLNISFNMDDDFDGLLNRLKTLHANGFFKKLHLIDRDMGSTPDFEMFMREMSSFRPLQSFSTLSNYPLIDAMSQMSQLEELHLTVKFVDDSKNVETIAVNLINLKRLWIAGGIDCVLPFLRHSKKLKFVSFYNGNDKRYLNLNNLNESRRMSGAQHKLQIGLWEQLYLATKWKENTRIHDLVEIVRKETIRKYFYY